ncbi:MAG: hypothetical protein QOG42_1051 [Solirubrobacteraceae bacterium]|nr:hypothetical protein [Solirubrobacteraceae bacterium]
MTQHGRRSRASSAICLLAALLLAGTLAAPSPAGAPASAQLRISTSEDYSQGNPIEGSVNEIEVSRVVKGQPDSVFHVMVYVARPFTLRLRPGTYRTSLSARTCDGNCGNLDNPPAARCRRTTALRAGDHVSLSVRIAWANPTTCRMSLRRG